MDKSLPLLVVGLGNPGKKYSMTRHNIGEFVLRYYANLLNFSWKKMDNFEGYLAKGLIKGQKVYFLLPQTYMNLSGRSVQKCMNYFTIPLSNVLILSDDTYIDFEDVRIKEKGSAAGHNGLKDIEQKLGTNEYKRMKIGVGEKTTLDLADYVLQEFTKEEQMRLELIADKCIKSIEEMISDCQDSFTK